MDAPDTSTFVELVRSGGSVLVASVVLVCVVGFAVHRLIFVINKAIITPMNEQGKYIAKSFERVAEQAACAAASNAEAARSNEQMSNHLTSALAHMQRMQEMQAAMQVASQARH